MHFQTTRIKSLEVIFLTSGVVENVFDAFPDHQNQVLKKLFFFTSEVLKKVFCAFPGNKNQVLKNLIFDV